MDGARFDSLARIAAIAQTRRTVLGAIAGAAISSLTGSPAVAAGRRRTGEICRKDGDCVSNVCGAAGSTGRRRCQCASATCVMLDGGPGDCSSGICACPDDESDTGCICLANNQGVLGSGIFFVIESVAASLDESDPLAGLQQISGVPQFTAAEGDCTVDADCQHVVDDLLPLLWCYDPKPFCVAGGQCSIHIDCQNVGHDGPCGA